MDEAVTEVEGDGVAGGTVADAEVVARAARADGECMPNMAAAGFPAAGGSKYGLTRAPAKKFKNWAFLAAVVGQVGSRHIGSRQIPDWDIPAAAG